MCAGLWILFAPQRQGKYSAIFPHPEVNKIYSENYTKIQLFNNCILV